MPNQVDSPDELPKALAVEGQLWVLGGAVLGFAFWFGLLYPLIPVTTTGWLMEMVAGLAVGLWGTASIFAIRWVQRQTRFRLLFRALAVVLALSLGVGIFWIAVNAQGWAASNFSYFGR